MGNPFVHPRRDLSTLSMFGRAFGSRRKFALRPLHIFFIGAQELGTGDVFPRREGIEMVQSHIKAGCMRAC